MKHKGFTLIEITVALAVIGVLALVSFTMLNTTPETRLIKCNEDLQAYVTMTEQLREQTGGRAPRPNEMYGWMDTEGYERDPAFKYLVNNVDANKGHGNDLDMCDEENPGKSTENRGCIDIKYVWVCNHDHGDLAKYCFADSSFGPVVIPIHPITINSNKHPVSGAQLTQMGNGDEFLRDLEYWTIQDPELQRWVDQ